MDFWDKSAKAFFVAVMNIEPTLDAMLTTPHRHRPDLSMKDGLARDEWGEPIPKVHPEVWIGATAFRGMDDRVSSNVLSTT